MSVWEVFSVNMLNWGRKIFSRTAVVFSCILMSYIVLFALLFRNNVTDWTWLRGGPTSPALLAMLGIAFVFSALFSIIFRKKAFDFSGIKGRVYVCCSWFCGLTMLVVFAHLIYKDLLYLSDSSSENLFLRGPSFQLLILLFVFSVGLTLVNRIFRFRHRIPLIFCFLLHYFFILLLFSGLFFGIGGGLEKSYHFMIFLLFYSLAYALAALLSCMLLYWGKKEAGKEKEYVSMFASGENTTDRGGRPS